MKTILFLVFVMLSSSMSSCCFNKHRNEPTYPQSVSGWKERKEQGVKIKGDFVLKKGNSTDNGMIKVKIMDLIPPDPCAEMGAFQRQARARIQFVRLPDNIVLLDELYAEKGSMTLPTIDEADFYEEFGIYVIYIHDINLKDEWVYFELRG